MVIEPMGNRQDLRVFTPRPGPGSLLSLNKPFFQKNNQSPFLIHQSALAP